MQKILYIGQMRNFTTCKARMQSLEELGCVAVPFDTSPYTGYPRRVLRTLAHRINVGPPVINMNRDVARFVEENAAEVSLVWIDKGRWLYPETIQFVKDATSAPIVHYTPDAHFYSNWSRHFLASIPLYDLLFTTKPFEVEYYRQYGARMVRFVDQGYDSARLFPQTLTAEERQRFGSDVCFIGHCEPHYTRLLKAAFSVAARHRVWGPGWRRYSRLHPWVKSGFSGDGVWGDDYRRALNGASIALCFLTKHCPETTTTRTFEVPGSGAFMLAERTEDHLALFKEGEEAEFFSGADELIDKLQFYLTHPVERQRIAAAGYKRCLTAGYSNHQRAQQMFALVNGLAQDSERKAI